MNCKDCKKRKEKKCEALGAYVPRKGTKCDGEHFEPKK